MTRFALRIAIVSLFVVGAVKPGVTPQQAAEEAQKAIDDTMAKNKK